MRALLHYLTVFAFSAGATAKAGTSCSGALLIISHKRDTTSDQIAGTYAETPDQMGGGRHIYKASRLSFGDARPWAQGVVQPPQLFYMSNYHMWVIGRNVGSAPFMYAARSTAMNPLMVPVTAWNSFSGTTMKQTGLEIRCLPATTAPTPMPTRAPSQAPTAYPTRAPTATR